MAAVMVEATEEVVGMVAVVARAAVARRRRWSKEA